MFKCFVRVLFKLYKQALIKQNKLSTRASSAPAQAGYIFIFFSLKEFKTTLMLLKAIAAAARTGLSRIPQNG